ncbi:MULTISPECIES: peptide-methionine (S)-S-oxide reductase MsrA [Asaia]|uniref:Peptide methionine sulfoxide reductase MsrA n=1 Tax=Asaia bogorensis TaxID=91915 RepID=A0A060QI96_9PROT|nr:MULTISPECIES: peptide-methionine (S)-S-oxide reductase MsrA [Asaia]ETC99161.1 methionine sulfoxide reductase A [Asaia sp. SF2.1]CDG40423.1 Peptide methionine sulfoxide reductase MsrA [Asaia bogorensis]
MMIRKNVLGVALATFSLYGILDEVTSRASAYPTLPEPVIVAKTGNDKPIGQMTAPPDDSRPGMTPSSVVFAGGCFWGVQSIFQHVRGVTATRAGYDGGARDTAQYERVSEGDTGHAESVEVEYDPTLVSFGTLMRIFFTVALDPTQIDQQFPDTGPQYRSVIFTRTAQQAREAEAYIAQLDAAHIFAQPIATHVQPDKAFTGAEREHQNFAARYPHNIYIETYDAPRLDALRASFPASWRTEPVLALSTAPGSLRMSNDSGRK